MQQMQDLYLLCAWVECKAPVHRCTYGLYHQSTECQSNDWEEGHNSFCASIAPYSWNPELISFISRPGNDLQTQLAFVIWQVNHWIVSHYVQIGTYALHAFGILAASNSPASTRGQDEAHSLCIYLAMNIKPSQSAYSPLHLIDARLETQSSVRLRHEICGVRSTIDPWPGAADQAKLFKMGGGRVVSVHIYCDPSVVDVTVPVPASLLLSQCTYDPHWREMLDPLATPIRRSGSALSLFVTPSSAYPTDETLLAMSKENILDKWTQFYAPVIRGAAYTAFGGRNTRKPNPRLLFVVELRHRNGGLALAHIAFKFGVVACELMAVDELLPWVLERSKGQSPSPFLSRKLQSCLAFLKGEGSAFIGNPKATFLPGVATCISADGVVEEFFPLAGVIQPHLRDANRWINSLPPALQFMKQFIDNGLYLPFSALEEDEPPNIKHTAFGHVRLPSNGSPG